MSSLQPIILHGHRKTIIFSKLKEQLCLVILAGPNPWKVAILLEELNVPYTVKVYTTPELKQPDFLKLNRNGMAPIIEDPNTGLLLAESGAIMDYVIEQYDKEKRISFNTIQEQYLVKQWLQFQTTAQGPTLQRVFFWTSASPNPDPRAKYVNDFRRVLQVLNDELADKTWLVGGKCSAADLSYVPFHGRMDFIMGKDKPDSKSIPKASSLSCRYLHFQTITLTPSF